MKLNIIKTPSIAIFVFSGKKTNETISFPNTHINFEKATALADSYIRSISLGIKITKEDFKTVRRLGNVAETLREWSDGLLEVTADSVTYAGEAINETLQDYLIELFITKKSAALADLAGWSNFIKSINKTNSYKIVNRLFLFLQKEDLTIDEDGNVLAWKVVRPSFMDKHSNSFDNHPGKICEVPRGKVDDDDTRTNGLHICSWGYLSSFASQGDPVVQVKIDPNDIVAIPLDYHGDKVRVCKYEVIRHVGNWGQEVSATNLPKAIGIAATL
jgi:hypothetical protein